MEHIKDTLSAVLRTIEGKHSTIDTAIDMAALLKKTLTQSQFKHIRFSSWHKGVVTVNVDSSAWIYQLNLHKQDLILKANTLIAGLKKKDSIKDIRFRLGETNG